MFHDIHISATDALYVKTSAGLGTYQEKKNIMLSTKKEPRECIELKLVFSKDRLDDILFTTYTALKLAIEFTFEQGQLKVPGQRGSDLTGTICRK